MLAGNLIKWQEQAIFAQQEHIVLIKELQNQLKIIRCMELKGFSKNQIKRMVLHKKKDKPQQSKKFISSIKYNKCSNSYVHVKKFVKNIPVKLEKYYMPNWNSWFLP